MNQVLHQNDTLQISFLPLAHALVRADLLLKTTIIGTCKVLGRSSRNLLVGFSIFIVHCAIGNAPDILGFCALRIK